MKTTAETVNEINEGDTVDIGPAYVGGGSYRRDEATGDWCVVRVYRMPHSGLPENIRIQKPGVEGYAFTVHVCRVKAVNGMPHQGYDR